MDKILDELRLRVGNYIGSVSARSVAPTVEGIEGLQNFDFDLPNEGRNDVEILELLDTYGSPGTVASTGPRYFGFVVGGALPATIASNYLATAWDQLGGLQIASPTVSKIESIAERWLVDVLDLDSKTAVGFVTGATMANFTGLAVARSVLLKKLQWDVEQDGLFGAPELTVVVGDEYHASMKKALSLVGFGRSRVKRVPVDDQGRVIASQFPDVDDRTVVCLQAGNVNSGSFDPLSELIPRLKSAGAWIHVDAAFGLWARCSDRYKHLISGIEKADSIATDAHKWLNVPYDSGIVFVNNRKALVNSMSATEAYLIEGELRDGYKYAPEMSRRGRGIDVWAALLSLGKKGLSELIERNCNQASMFARGLEGAGFDILNDVVLNQVLVSFGSDERTNAVIAAVQEEGTMWAGGTNWQGQTAMRISVSSWATTDEDIARSLEAVVRVANDII